MIYTLSIAPALDYTMDLQDKPLRIGRVNRPISKGISLGGKGITVSRMLSNLHVESIPILAVGGKNGETIKDLVSKEFKNAIYLSTETESRIDVMVTGYEQDTRFDPPAPKITQAGLSKLFIELKNILKDDDILVLAGSLGQERRDLYAQIIDECTKNKNVKVFLDTVDDALVNALKQHPFMIKPNKDELGDIVGKELNGIDEIIQSAKELKEYGPKSILVTLGSHGAYYFAEDKKIYKCSCAIGTQVSAVGAGDSSIAGFIKGLAEKEPIEQCLVYSMAAGGATAFSEYLGTYDLFSSLKEQIHVERVE